MAKRKANPDSATQSKKSEDPFIASWFAEKASDQSMNQGLLTVLHAAYQQDTSEAAIVELLIQSSQKPEGTDAADQAD